MSADAGEKNDIVGKLQLVLFAQYLCKNGRGKIPGTFHSPKHGGYLC